ncbi:MAG: putative peptide zinc metalloprotease protein [Acidobacteriota bacterium]|nr:putative peptide zinc metalloprotease protein [Acidobacteriota bacterium]
MSYAQEEVVEVFEFTHQPDGDDVIIGRPETNTFLALPSDAVDILSELAQGRSIGEVQDNFERAHGVRPDVADLLDILEQKGFVRHRDSAQGSWDHGASGIAPQNVRYHFTNISPETARLFFGSAALSVYSAIFVAAVAVCIVQPALIPGSHSLVFEHHGSLKLLMFAFLAYSTIFVHEFGHLLAARAVGVSSKIGISNRLWVLVAETDLTGLWALPKAKRYLPILAGPIVDLVSASLIVLVLFASGRNLFLLPSSVVEIGRAAVFMYMMRLLWQCFFFVRTDFYYVFANLFGCKSLMKDTQTFLHNLASKLFNSTTANDQGHIPAREMRVVRAYSLLWLLGRAVAFVSLFLITLPVMSRYLSNVVSALQRGYAVDLYGFVDSLLVTVLNLTPLLLGLSLWLVSLMKRRTA